MIFKDFPYITLKINPTAIAFPHLLEFPVPTENAIAFTNPNQTPSPALPLFKFALDGWTGLGEDAIGVFKPC